MVVSSPGTAPSPTKVHPSLLFPPKFSPGMVHRMAPVPTEQKTHVNRGDLVRAIAKDTGVPAATVNMVLGSLMDMVVMNLRRGRRVMIPGFGRWEARTKSASTQRNPRNGEIMEIPERQTAVFYPAPEMKKKLNLKRRKES